MLITDTFFADVTVNLTAAAALLGLIAALVHSWLTAVDEAQQGHHRAWSRGVIPQIELLHLVALSVVVCGLAARMTYWIEMICVPGDGPMIYRMDPSRLPVENAAELAFTVALVACHIWIVAHPVARRRRTLNSGSTAHHLPRLAPSAMQVTMRVARPIAWLGLSIVIVFGAVHSLAALMAMILSVSAWALITCLLLHFAEDASATEVPSQRMKSW